MKGLKRTFQLTDRGATGLTRAILTTFFQHMILLLPVMAVMLFSQKILEGGTPNPTVYVLSLIHI